jgi:hypothetical protein
MTTMASTISVAEDLRGIWECSLPCAKVIERMFDERMPQHVSLCIFLTRIDRNPVASRGFPWARAMTMSENELADVIRSTHDRFHSAPP